MAKRILVIDDEKIITKSLQRLLKKEGYEITLSHSGQEAIEKVKQQDFDLIICDVRMPQMDGVETIEGIRRYLKNFKKPSIPEILITGYADEEKYKCAIDLKVADYIFKPFDAYQLLDTVKKNLNASR